MLCIFQSRELEAEVGAHGGVDEFTHGLFIPVYIQGTQYTFFHFVGIEICERKTVSLAGIFVVRSDGILEAARLSDDRESTVSHGEHLAYTAGLESGWHEIEIASGIDKVGKIVVVSYV